MVTFLSVGLASCSSDDSDEAEKDDGVDTSPITLFAGNNKIIMGADTIFSSNRFVAYGKGNTVNAWHVGQTELLVNNKKRIAITVLPKYTLYDDPICEWGCSRDYIKNHQKQGSINSKSNEKILAYDNAGAATILSYSFENDKLKSVIAIVSLKHYSQYADYLTERFIMLPYYKGEDTYFIGADGLDEKSRKTVAVLSNYDTRYLATVYMPANDYVTRSISKDTLNEVKELLKHFE